MHTDSGTIKEHFILMGAGGGILIRRTFSNRQQFLDRSHSGSGHCLPPGLSASSFSALSAPIDAEVHLTG